jgi:hypothetical protein
LQVLSEGSHFGSCVLKWHNQAGVKAQHVMLEHVGITGNEQEMILNKSVHWAFRVGRTGFSLSLSYEPLPSQRQTG